MLIGYEIFDFTQPIARKRIDEFCIDSKGLRDSAIHWSIIQEEDFIGKITSLGYHMMKLKNSLKNL
jgi:hypothetical protein